jgi:serine/threonine protein kinase/Tfp pilus assembly protein PilF
MSEREVFLQALDLKDAAERARFLDRACADQPLVRAQVDQLLKAHEQVGQFLEQPHPAAGAGEHTESYTSGSFGTDRPGLVIAGKYKLLQRIGEGGMGSVWMADQLEPVRRRVAVKLISAERGASHSILSRFEAERQAIALMDHPHIARLLDAGSTDGEIGARPFFVMELVKGVPLTNFCDEHKLGIPERLRLFMQICGAVQHAHQKGIIHRDLKPTNILVELHDDKPVPKVIDFGLAKALSGQPLTEHTLFTGFGTVAGTPLYMAPEQAKFNAIDIDTRADIYALGVILYELLTGSTPIERATLKQAAFDEILRVIRESEPPTPSRRLSTTQSKPSVAANRHTEPQKLGRFVKGELDWIVMKALAKERDRRYETANGFARDIERFLNQDAVLAGPPSASYRLRKFVQRNRGQVIAGALVLLALVAGIAGTTIGLIRADQQRRLAQANEEKAIQAADAERQARDQEAQQRAHAERARDRTRQALDAMTSTVTGDSLTTQKEISADQKKFLTEVLKYYQEFAGEKADDETSRARTAAAGERVGLIERRLGRREEAGAAFRMARDGYARLATDFPAVPEYRHQLGRNRSHLGEVLQDLGKRSEAEDEHRQALGIQEKLVGDFPTVPEYRQLLAKNHNFLGILLQDLGQRSEAEGEYRKAISIQEKLAADFPTVPAHRQDLVQSHNDLAILLAELGNGSEAEQEYRHAVAIQEKLTADFPGVPDYRLSLANSRSNLGLLLSNLGKPSKAEEQYRQALVIREKLVADFPAVPGYRNHLAIGEGNLAILLEDLGKPSEAEELHRKALAIREKLAADFPAVPEYRSHLAASHNNVGHLLGGFRRSDPDEEEQHYRKALAIRVKLAADFPAIPEYRSDLAATHDNLGLLLKAMGKPSDAEQQLRRAVAIMEKLGADFPAVPQYRTRLAGSHANVGNLLAELGGRANGQEAEEHIRKALVIQEKLVADFPAVPEYGRDRAVNHKNLADVLRGLGKRSEAEHEYREALTMLEKLVADSPAVPRYRQGLARTHLDLGLFSADLGKYSQAEDEYRKALAIREKLVADFPTVPAYRSMLAESRVAVCLSRIKAGQLTQAIAEVAELEKSSNWNAVDWYNFACVYAVASGKDTPKKQEFGDHAMELLAKAVKAGYKDAAQFRQDTDLDSLRERDDFKKLLADLTSAKSPTKHP